MAEKVPHYRKYNLQEAEWSLSPELAQSWFSGPSGLLHAKTRCSDCLFFQQQQGLTVVKDHGSHLRVHRVDSRNNGDNQLKASSGVYGSSHLLNERIVLCRCGLLINRQLKSLQDALTRERRVEASSSSLLNPDIIITSSDSYQDCTPTKEELRQEREDLSSRNVGTQQPPEGKKALQLELDVSAPKFWYWKVGRGLRCAKGQHCKHTIRSRAGLNALRVTTCFCNLSTDLSARAEVQPSIKSLTSGSSWRLTGAGGHLRSRSRTKLSIPGQKPEGSRGHQNRETNGRVGRLTDPSLARSFTRPGAASHRPGREAALAFATISTKRLGCTHPRSWPRETQSSPQRIDAPPPAPLGLWLPLHRRRPRVARVNSNPPAPSPLNLPVADAAAPAAPWAEDWTAEPRAAAAAAPPHPPWTPPPPDALTSLPGGGKRGRTGRARQRRRRQSREKHHAEEEAAGAPARSSWPPPRPPPGLMWTAVCRACPLIISAAFAPSSSVHWDTPTYWKYLGTQAGLPLEPPDVWRPWCLAPQEEKEKRSCGLPCSSLLNHGSPDSANAVVRSRIRSLYTTLFEFNNEMEDFLCDLQCDHSFLKMVQALGFIAESPSDGTHTLSYDASVAPLWKMQTWPLNLRLRNPDSLLPESLPGSGVFNLSNLYFTVVVQCDKVAQKSFWDVHISAAMNSKQALPESPNPREQGAQLTRLAPL
ncbi:hypothetical protein ACRRTK_000449 [Alexandromys fortis]